MTLRECTACRQHLDEEMFGRHTNRGKVGLRHVCKPCDVVQNRQRRARRLKKAGRACPSCRQAKDITEPPGKCAACVVVAFANHMGKGLPLATGRPGCVVDRGVCRVLDEANERWVEMPVKHCKRCGVDQHLDVCLDCTAPVGAGDIQKSVRPLRRCVECSGWTPNVRCSGCAL